MNQMGMVVGLVAVIGWLILATRNSELRGLSMGRTLRLASIWAAIIIALVLLIELSGWRIGK